MPNTHRRRNETVELRRVVGVNTPVGSRDSWPSLQFPVMTSDDIMTSLLKKRYKNLRILHYAADSNVYKHAAPYVTSYRTSIPLAAEL